MKYSIIWSEKKNNDWMVATLRNEAGIEYKDVSINRQNKKGEVFPLFDSVMTGHTIEGEYWETPDKSKKYLFPPKVATTRSFGGSGAINKAMEKKDASIARFQDNKEFSIKESASMRDAVQLAIAERELQPVPEDLEVLIKKWRKFILDNWSLPF